MSVRTDKISSLLKKDLAPILQDYQNNNMITITDVTITPDLGVAKVFISIMGGGNSKAFFQHLEEHVSDIRYKLSKKIRNQMRRMPEIHLYLDDTASYAEKIEEVFKKIHEHDDSFKKPSDSNE
ncbi:ribosome-binding factor A [bacterium]|nr:MAG: ribosome-binding factor A [bacterium]